MRRNVIALGTAFVIGVSATGFSLYLTNATPSVPAISAAEAARTDRPWVVKLHAQWCPICRLTKGVWSRIEGTYADRVRLVVFDFTDDETTAASRAEAERLGLTELFEQSGFATGPIVVLDSSTKEVLAWISGSRDFAEYGAAIDAALQGVSR
ncbi:MAG TPA: thioredoxin family protein [Gammaproteobacteria bacterium]